MRKIKVFTNNDLDGAGCLLVLRWMSEGEYSIDHKMSNVFKLENDYNSFMSSSSQSEYSNIFILNMIPEFTLDERVSVFSKSTTNRPDIAGKVCGCTTSTRLMCSVLKQYDKLSEERLEVAMEIDGYHSSDTISHKGIILKAIFSYGDNKFSGFYERFHNGIGELTEKEECIVKEYMQSFIGQYKGLELAEHELYDGMFMSLVPNMTHKQELFNQIFKKHNPKRMVFLVDAQNGLISVRKNHDYVFDMDTLCKSYINGKALGDYAGGQLTPKFLEFTKKFK